MDGSAATMERPAPAAHAEKDDGLGPVGSDPDAAGAGDPAQDDPLATEGLEGMGVPDPYGGAGEPPTPPAALPDDGGEGEDEDSEPGSQLFLLGNRKLGIKVAGRMPDSSVLKFKGGKVALGGQFDRGDVISTVDVWQVTGDNDQDTIDTLTHKVKSTSKAQNATLCSTQTLGDFLALKLAEHEVFGPLLAELRIAVGLTDQD